MIALSFVFSIVPAVVLAQSSLVEGVTFTSKYFELVKKLGVAARVSVINPNEVMTDRMREQQDHEATSAMRVIGQPLESFLRTLAGPDCPYPLLAGLILDYEYLRPMDESPNKGRMYIMYIGELHWPFPAPLMADMIRIRLSWDTPHVTREVLTSLLIRWGRDHIEEPPSDAKEMPRLKVKGLLDDLKDPDLERSSWRKHQTVRELLRRALTPPEVSTLQEIARKAASPARVSAIQILSVGGWVKDATFYSAMLKDPAVEVQQAAFWALLTVGDKAALKAVQDFPGRASAIIERFKQTHPLATDEQLQFEIGSFDWLIASTQGTRTPRPRAPAPPPKPSPEPRFPDGLDDESALPLSADPVSP